MRTASEEEEEAEESIRIRRLLSQTKFGSRVSVYSTGPLGLIGSAKVKQNSALVFRRVETKIFVFVF
jgi:hypothetical protein